MPGFEPTPRVQELRKQLLAFMDEHVYPNEATWAAQVGAGCPVEYVSNHAPVQVRSRWGVGR